MISYRRANKGDMYFVAKIHTIIFHDYFLTLLGTDLLSKYYEEFLNENNLLY